MKNIYTTSDKQYLSYPKMADSNDNESNTDIEITEDVKDESIKQNPPPKAKPQKDYITKHRHNLTPGVRRRILDEYDRGIENPNFEVIICTNGKRQLRKRKTPLQSTHNPSPQQQSQQPPQPQPLHTHESQPTQHHVSWADSIQYYNIQNTFNEQVIKQIEDLQSRISHQNDKHKKLKSKYRKLKRSLYEDEEEADESINNQNDNTAAEPSTQSPQPEDLQQQYQQQLPLKRNMRDAVDFSRYGFRMY